MPKSCRDSRLMVSSTAGGVASATEKKSETVVPLPDSDSTSMNPRWFSNHAEIAKGTLRSVINLSGLDAFLYMK
jgi:hypothetical protein